MAEAISQTYYNTLSEFLDSLPTKPCPSTPSNRYFCTVCERLNKSIAARCSYSNMQTTGEIKEEGGTSTQFIPLSSETETQLGDTSQDSSEKVEFKIVTPKRVDKDYPLFEIVQPKDKKIKPIEMELLEDVAIEFEPTSDEPVEVEAFEVTPLDESDEDAEVAEVMEVDVVEADLASEYIESGQTYPEFIPVQPQPSAREIKPVTQKLPKKAAPKLDVPPGQATWEPPQQIPKQSQPQLKKHIQPVQPYPTKIPATKTPTLATVTKTPKKIAIVKKAPKVK